MGYAPLLALLEPAIAQGFNRLAIIGVDRETIKKRPGIIRRGRAFAQHVDQKRCEKKPVRIHQ